MLLWKISYTQPNSGMYSSGHCLDWGQGKGDYSGKGNSLENKLLH